MMASVHLINIPHAWRPGYSIISDRGNSMKRLLFLLVVALLPAPGPTQAPAGWLQWGYNAMQLAPSVPWENDAVKHEIPGNGRM